MGVVESREQPAAVTIPLHGFLGVALERLVIGYVRVSTSKAEQATSAEGQLHDLRTKWACDRIITERRGAYADRVRPGWQEVNHLVAQGQVGLVVVSDQSRLARDLSDQQFLEMCAVMGTKVVSVHGDEIENQTINGLLSTGLMSVVNRVHSRVISVKVKEGVRRRREAGFYGRGMVPFGYAFHEGHIVKHEEHFPYARWLVERMMERQCNMIAVMRVLPPDFPRRFSRHGLKAWITNPILRGGVGLDQDRRTKEYRRVVWGQTPPLITLEEWRTITRQLQHRRRVRGGGMRGTRQHLFSGLIRCEECRKRLWWAASSRRPKPRYKCGTPDCKLAWQEVNEEVVADAAKQALAKMAQTLAKKAAEYAGQGPGESVEEMEMRQQLEQLQDLRDQGVPGLRHPITALREQLAARAAIRGAEMPPAAYQRLFEAPETFNLATKAELRVLMVEYVERIEFRGPDKPLVVRLRRASSDLGT